MISSKFQSTNAIVLMTICMLVVATERTVTCAEPLLDTVFGSTVLLTVLYDDAVRDDLGISESTNAKLLKLQKRIRIKQGQLVKQATLDRRNGLEVDLKAQIVKHYGTILPSLAETLSEAEFRRLEQICFQRLLRPYKLEPLLYQRVVEELQLTSTDTHALSKVLRFEYQKFSDESKAIRAEHQSAICSILTNPQQSMLEGLFGDPYDVVSSNWDILTAQKTCSVDVCPWIYVLSDEQARKELEIIDEQALEIEKLQEAVFDAELERTQQVDGNAPEVDVESIAIATRVQLAKILLPRQIKRLNQIVIQLKAHEQSPIPLLSDVVAETLGLTEIQRRQIREGHTIGQQKTTDRIDQCWRETLSRVIGSLTNDQQLRYQRLVGPDVDH